MIITRTFRALVAQLADDGILDPLNKPMALFAVWADLCRLAGEPEPPEVAALLDAPACATPARPPLPAALAVVRVVECAPA